MLFDDKTKGIAQAYLTMLEAKKTEAKMDPVGKHDADIDNDGDKDKSDEYLIKRRAAISKSVKEDKVDEAACGTGMPKAKKEAIEITIGGKSEVSKKGMKDKEGGDEEEESDDDEGSSDDKEVEIKTKKTDGDSDGKKKKEMPAFMKKEGYKSDAQRKAVWAARNEKGIKEAKSAGSAYAIGMDSAMKSTGDNPPLEKGTIKKAHKIAKSIMKKESTVWNWDEIIEASDEEIDALIETLEGDDLESFMSEFNELTEMYKQAPPNETTVKTGKEKLEPRASAEKSFVDMHTQVDKDHPFEKDQHMQGVKSQAPARPGDKRANEPLKTLKDIRK